MSDYASRTPFIEKMWRALIHIPVGIFNAFCVYVGVIWGVLFFAGFFLYELNEDWRIKDGAYLDIFGWLIGFGIGTTVKFLAIGKG